MNKKIVILVALLFIFPVYADCGLEDIIKGLKTTPYSGITPIPPQTRETKQEKTQIMGSEFTVTFYVSELSFREIAKFYRERFGREGWEDAAFDKKFEELKKKDFFAQLQAFKKENEIINIQLLPSQDPKKTVFSLTRGEISSSKANSSVLSEVEFRDIPVYTNATILPLSSIRASDKEQVGYSTHDRAEKVLRFYKEKLSVSGWVIQNELPLTDYNGSQSLENCPECQEFPVKTITEIQGSMMRMGSFQIAKQGRICYIVATEVALASSQESETIISIKCNK